MENKTLTFFVFQKGKSSVVDPDLPDPYFFAGSGSYPINTVLLLYSHKKSTSFRVKLVYKC